MRIVRCGTGRRLVRCATGRRLVRCGGFTPGDDCPWCSSYGYATPSQLGLSYIPPADCCRDAGIDESARHEWNAGSSHILNQTTAAYNCGFTSGVIDPFLSAYDYDVSGCVGQGSLVRTFYSSWAVVFGEDEFGRYIRIQMDPPCQYIGVNYARFDSDRVYLLGDCAGPWTLTSIYPPNCEGAGGLNHIPASVTVWAI